MEPTLGLLFIFQIDVFHYHKVSTCWGSRGCEGGGGESVVAVAALVGVGAT